MKKPIDLSKRGSKNRAIGKAGELEVIAYFKSATIQVENELGIPEGKRLSERIQRNMQQTIAGGDDIVGIIGHSVEVKNCKVAQLNSWWSQCLRQARYHLDYPTPLLVYKTDRLWMCRVGVNTYEPSDDFLNYALLDYLPLYKEHVKHWYAVHAVSAAIKPYGLTLTIRS